MSNMVNSLYNMRLLDDLAGKDTAVHRIHPLSQLITLLAFLATVVSFGRYDTSSMLPLVFYPVLIIALGDLPLIPLLKRVLAVQPLIIGIGILNPLFDHNMVNIGGQDVSSGWLTFISIFIKSVLTVTAGILLISTTGIDRLSSALRMLKVPKIFVLQLLLTYRYISVLAEETYRLSTAYSLRAPRHSGIHIRLWGPFAGQLLLRAFDRADRVYKAMRLRGFSGDYNMGGLSEIKSVDFVWLVAWILFFAAARMYNIPMLLGLIFNI